MPDRFPNKPEEPTGWNEEQLEFLKNFYKEKGLSPDSPIGEKIKTIKEYLGGQNSFHAREIAEVIPDEPPETMLRLKYCLVTDEMKLGCLESEILINAGLYNPPSM